MDAGTWLNISLVLLFILVGGVFAGTEIALVSLRESQIDQLEQKSARGARVASVARDPNRFLAAVQIGVTVAGFFSAAYGASTIAPDLVPALESAGLPTGVAQNVALIGMTLLIAYLSLVLGELVPKRFALQRSASVALAVAPPLDRFATAMRPVIWLLSVSTNAVVRLVGGDPSAKSEAMSDEELRELVLRHESLPEDERQILDDVFEAAHRSLGEVMRPRGEVAFLPADLLLARAVEEVTSRPFSRYPVTGDGFDDVLGFLHVRDLLGAAADDARTVRDVMRPIIALPVTGRLLPSLSHLRDEGVHIAVVVDEYGGTDGIVTLEDLVEELVGDIRDEYDPESAPSEDGTDDAGELDAGLTIEEFAERTGVELADGPYETVAGFLMSRLGRLGETGDAVPVDGGRLLEVTEVAGRRITRVRLAPAPAVVADPAAGTAPGEEPTPVAEQGPGQGSGS